MKKKKSNIFTIVFYVLLVAIIIFAVVKILDRDEEELAYSEMMEYFENDRVYSFTLNESTLVLEVYKDENATVENKGETEFIEYELRFYDIFYNEFMELKNEGRLTRLAKYDFPPVQESPWIVQYLPYIILILLFVIFMVFSMRQTGGGKMGGFGKSKARTVTTEKVLFSDVAGADEEKEELEEVVQYLRNPSKFTRLGAKIPHGVLLVGPPGTGKTLLAKAVAGEAGVPFYSMSGSDFVEMYVGVGASRVRDLFENARRSNAAIIFIDEIDAVGRQRGAGLGGGHDEREQTLNQLLVEMDGFDGHSGIIVIAATNRPDILDSALLRPGRFDRQITVGYPDLKGREDILKVHSKSKPFEETVELRRIAQITVGFTGADLANLLNESALLAARRGKNLIGMSEIEDAMIKITVGTQKRAKKMSDKERRNTAVHEAGHAILSHVLPSQDPVRQISIIPSGRALGYTLTPPVEDKYSESKQELKERIAMMLGGRVAEQLLFGDYTGGASNDIMRATEVARKMVTVYGMSEELGTIHFGSNHSDEAVFLGRDFNSNPSYSDATAAKIDAEVKKIIDEAYNLAKEVLTKHRDKIDFITEFLLRNEVMDDEQFELAMKDGVTMEEVENLMTEKKRRSEEENRRKAQKAEEEKLAEAQRRRELEKMLGINDEENDDEQSPQDQKELPSENGKDE
ncbi:MAG: ATP-dependent zinc metalloprotease FtsH [Clostridia bacterium]|nr:ATP-dependent zinc metalloprotease FtsH [Clostridia bacterium]